MGKYYILQFRPKGPRDGWKLFRRESRIQVYRNEEKAREDSSKYQNELEKAFRYKQIKVHPRIEHPRCRWQDIE